MDEHTLSLLEYRRLLDLLAGYAQSEPGALACGELRPDLEPEEVLYRWNLVDEAKRAINLEGRPSLGDLCDISGLLGDLEVEGRILGPLELLKVLRVVRTSRLARNFLKGLVEISPEIYRISLDLPVFQDLEQSLERSIGPEGEILDSASVELSRIRRELGGLRGAIHSRMNNLMRRDVTRNALQDDIITQRGDRYVIPVKAGQRRDVPGLVHAYSNSGATAYVEPMEMVEDNNRLNFLNQREKQEIERILARLSHTTAGLGPDIKEASDLLTELDVLFAQGALSRNQKALAPQLSTEGETDLKEARHPLLMSRLAEAGLTVVPVDLKMDPENRVLVISGVNAGGKTVALKTMGLMALMVRTGLHLPVAEGGRVGFYDEVFASIGDEQDLNTDLSTFSGHVRRLAGVLAETTDRSLVLLDELGTGTDPAEGAALALAILDELREMGAWVMTATHYHLLKNWAQLTDGVENAAVRTDSKGRPTYGVVYGAPGFSAGLAMAREMGMAADIVAKAESYLDEGQKRTMELMQRLEEERARLQESRRHCEYIENELSMSWAAYKKSEEKRVKKFERETKDMRSKVEKSLSKAEREFRRIKKEMKERTRPDVQADLTAGFRRTQKDLRESLPKPAVTVVERLDKVAEGDRVLIAGLNKEGRVVSLDESKGKAEVDLGGMIVKTDLKSLAKPGAQGRKKQKSGVTYNSFSRAPLELNLVGMTVDEALPEVDKSLDQAMLDGLKRFTIIHGIGTGRLRDAVRGFLKHEPRVKDFRRGENRSGGEGVTVIELRE